MAKRGKGKSVPEASPRPDEEKEVNADLATSDEVKNDEEEMKDVEELKDGEEVKDAEDANEDEDEVEEDGEEVKKDEEVVEEDKETTNVVSGTEDKMEEDKKEEVKAEVNDVKAITKSKRKRLRKKKKPAAPAGEASAAKDSKKPATSEPVEKDGKKADSMGLIFMCSSKTKKDCYQYKVLGLPAAKKELVAKVYKGMRLFLFDIDLRLLYGVYKAAGPGGFNLEPKAFNSAFPSQVRFTVLDDCSPLPEEKFKPAIKDNYFAKNKFKCELTPEQVKNLRKLFQSTTADKGKPKQGGKPGPSRAAARGFADRGASKKMDRPLLVGGPRYRRGPPIYERELPVYEREPYAAPLPPSYAAPLPPSYVYERPSEMDYYRRDPPRALGLRDTIEYRDPYSYRQTLPYEVRHVPAPPAYAPSSIYRY